MRTSEYEPREGAISNQMLRALAASAPAALLCTLGSRRRDDADAGAGALRVCGGATARCVERTRNFHDVYALVEPERPLGVGSFGTVFPGVHRETGEIFAVKHYPASAFASAAEAERRVLYESEILRVVGEHRNISGVVDVFVGAAASGVPAVAPTAAAAEAREPGAFLVMEMATGGELFDRLVARGPYSEAAAARMLREIVDAVAYIHASGVVHFDLKPENVLLASPAADDCDVRIVDFGSARCVGSAAEEAAIAREMLGSGPTVAYSAPEVLAGAGASHKADVFSLGVLMHLLLFGVHPFDPRNDASNAQVEEGLAGVVLGGRRG